LKGCSPEFLNHPARMVSPHFELLSHSCFSYLSFNLRNTLLTRYRYTFVYSLTDKMPGIHISPRQLLAGLALIGVTNACQYGLYNNETGPGWGYRQCTFGVSPSGSFCEIMLIDISVFLRFARWETRRFPRLLSTRRPSIHPSCNMYQSRLFGIYHYLLRDTLANYR
jgi:hypothetical protein